MNQIEITPIKDSDPLNYKEKSKSNIESFIGTIKVPVGITKPLTLSFNNLETDQTFTEQISIPLATTEGTLIASTNRGIKVMNEGGGVKTFVVRRGNVQRAPCLRFESILDAKIFKSKIDQYWAELFDRNLVQSCTRFGKLVDVKCMQLNDVVHVRFSVDSNEASGQNMVSIIADRCINKLLKLIRSKENEKYQFPKSILKVWMDGGLSGEKVNSELNILDGRGVGVVARAQIHKSVLQKVCRVHPREIIEFYDIFTKSNLLTGAKISHASLTNIAPAIFLATGQDLGSITESTTAHSNLRYDEEKEILYWDTHCTNLLVASIGGGTSLPTQKEALDILGCDKRKHEYHDRKSEKLAQIIAAAALANEISFFSSICSQEWIKAHANLKHRL